MSLVFSDPLYFSQEENQQLFPTPLRRTGDRQTMEGKQQAELCKLASTGQNTQKHFVLDLQGLVLLAGVLQGWLL